MGDVVLNIVDCLLDSGIDEESHEGLLLGLVADLGGKDRVTLLKEGFVIFASI